MNMIRLRVSLVPALVLLVGVATEASEPDLIVYKTINETDLKLHVFSPEHHQSGEARPAIVFFFGGGWNGGTPEQFYPQSKHLADRGMVAICAEYRVKSRHGAEPRDCVADGKSAMRWVRTHAEELGIDPEMIAAGGGSAGGHVAAAIATTNGFDEPGEDTSVSCRPDALVLFNPVFDNGPGGYGHERVREYWREFSPMHNLDTRTPPTIVFLGSRDSLIPVATAEEYQRRMEERGGRCELRIYEGQKHGFFNQGRKNSKYAETLAEMDNFLQTLGFVSAGAAPESDAATARDDRMAWWREAKFGMFVHWGIYSVTGGQYRGQELPNSAEWMMARGKIPIAEYEQYAARFNPSRFDADAFVGLAKQAGMKYLVITAKHHDGFAMFDSSSNDFNVVDATPFKRDIMKELADACQKQGIRFGFYYSQAQDWHHPGGFGNGWDKTIKRVSSDEYVSQKAVPEVKQLLTDYGPIGIFWWDTPRKMSRESFDSLHTLTELQPQTITNDRLGDDYPGDYKTFERNIPKQKPPAEDWEVCMPISGSWGYKRSDRSFKSTEKLIQNLADIASMGGNYLLNVSPTGEGTLLPEAVERLQAVGAWMDVNAESIYGTSASPLGKLEWGRCTMKETADGTTLYLHVFDWPQDGKLLAPGLKSQVKRAYLVAGNTELRTETVSDGLLLHQFPAEPTDPYNSVVAVELQGDVKVEEQKPKLDGKGSLVLSAESAYLHNNEGAPPIRLRENGESTNLSHWTDPQAWAEWSVTVSEPGRYDIFCELAVQETKSRFSIGLPSQLSEVEVTSTGGYGNYATRHLATILFDQAGVFTLRMKPDPKGWEPVNVRQLELKSAGSDGK